MWMSFPKMDASFGNVTVATPRISTEYIIAQSGQFYRGEPETKRIVTNLLAQVAA